MQKRWTEEEKSKLIELYTSGVSLKDIGKQLANRSYIAIDSKIASLGLKRDRNPLWTTEEKEIFQKLRSEGKTYTEIGKILNKTEKAIVMQVTKKRLKQTFSKNWNGQEMEKLVSLVNDGLSYGEIAICLNKTPRAVGHKVQRLGLVSKYERSMTNPIKHNIEENPKNFLSLIRQKLTNCRSNMLSKGLTFCINSDDILKLWDKQNGICHYSGLKMKINGGLYGWSIDRIESWRGYETNNIVLCCYVFNLMKMQLLQSEFINLCKIVANHSNSDFS